MWNYILFGVIVFHLVVGFGWLFWKLEMQKGKSKIKEESLNDDISKDEKQI